MNAPIDAVIMWVDGSDPDFINSQNHYLTATKRPVINSAARHRDNGELRFALRGLIHHTPWLRKIYVVTNGQRPSWLNFDNEKIVHVKHSDIFPESDLLPCFNSFAIESCVYRIEGLSETFVRLSDDFFVARPASREDILGPSGLGRQIYRGMVQSEPKNRYQRQIKNNADLFEAKLGHRPAYNYAHAPQVRTRDAFHEFVELFADEINVTRNNRFRGPDDLIPLFLYPYFHAFSYDRESFDALMSNNSTDNSLIVGKDNSCWYQQVQVGRAESGWQRKLSRAVNAPPLYLNINDSFTAENIEEERVIMEKALDQLFPNPTEFEK